MTRMAKGFSALILLLGMMLCASCGTLSDDSKDSTFETDPPEITTAPTTTEDTNSIQVSVDPMTAASRWLSFESNGDGTCRLTGIGSCTDTCLIIPDMSDSGDKVVSIAADAFAGNTNISAVQIPAGVTDIGNGAFAACTALAYISVSDGNSAYCDIGGILYSADKTQLLCIPAGSSLSSITVTLQVTSIAPRASEGCTKITKLLFEGSEEEWKKITVGAGNDALTSITPTYMKQAGK
ncbi:MAG: leucine-rich repeat protein [Clostridia bacterium]|nr:leucine-rich repeat protein [Clostridia bacterium]